MNLFSLYTPCAAYQFQPHGRSIHPGNEVFFFFDSNSLKSFASERAAATSLLLPERWRCAKDRQQAFGRRSRVGRGHVCCRPASATWAPGARLYWSLEELQLACHPPYHSEPNAPRNRWCGVCGVRHPRGSRVTRVVGSADDPPPEHGRATKQSISA